MKPGKLGVALEGDDSSDAPWAAANIIAEFPEKMLSAYKDQLLELAAYEWVYQKTPAQAALKKLSENVTWQPDRARGRMQCRVLNHRLFAVAATANGFV